MNAIRASIAAAGLFLAIQPASAICKVNAVQFDIDAETRFDITAAPGDFCSGLFNFRGWKIEKIVVPEQPKNGLVNIKDNTWKYQSFQKFKGRDSFTLRVFAIDPKGKKGDGKVIANIVVQ